MFLGASKVVRIVMEGVTCGSTRYCHVDRHMEVHMGRHMGEGPHNALFSTCTCVQAEVDVLKISLKISQCGKDTCQWFKGASLPPRHLPCSMSFRGTFPTTYLLGSLGQATLDFQEFIWTFLALKVLLSPLSSLHSRSCNSSHCPPIALPFISSGGTCILHYCNSGGYPSSQ